MRKTDRQATHSPRRAQGAAPTPAPAVAPHPITDALGCVRARLADIAREARDALPYAVDLATEVRDAQSRAFPLLDAIRNIQVDCDEALEVAAEIAPAAPSVVTAPAPPPPADALAPGAVAAAKCSLEACIAVARRALGRLPTGAAGREAREALGAIAAQVGALDAPPVTAEQATRALAAHGAHTEARDQRGRFTRVDVINSGSRTQGGTSAAYLRARLARDAPAALAALDRGEYTSVRAAARAAGIVKVPDRLAAVVRQVERMSRDEPAEVMPAGDVLEELAAGRAPGALLELVAAAFDRSTAESGDGPHVLLVAANGQVGHVSGHARRVLVGGGGDG